MLIFINEKCEEIESVAVSNVIMLDEAFAVSAIYISEASRFVSYIISRAHTSAPFLSCPILFWFFNF